MDNETLIQMLENRSGHGITSVSDCEWLALDFKSRAGLSIGVNTLKRLLGFRKEDVSTHHPSTLDVVAKYLGYRCWKEVEDYVKGSSSEFGHNSEVVNAGSLTVGTTVRITYKPDRKVVMKYSGDYKWTVVESVNSKLAEGDSVILHQLSLGHPLFIEEVVRNCVSLGEYTAAKIGGLTSIDLY